MTRLICHIYTVFFASVCDYFADALDHSSSNRSVRLHSEGWVWWSEGFSEAAGAGCFQSVQQ